MAYFGYTNHIMTGTLTGGGSDVTNIQTRLGSDVWSAGGLNVAGGAYLNLDSGSTSSKWRIVALFRTNFTTSASMVVKLGTSSGAGDVYTSGTISGVVAGRNCLLVILDQEYTARYLRIEITDTTNTDSQVTVGLAFAGPVEGLTYGPAFGSSLGLQVSQQDAQTIGGQEYPLLNFTRYGWELQFDAVQDAEVESLVVPLERYASTGENVLFVPFEDGTRLMEQSVYGRPVRTGRVSVQTKNWSVNTWAFQISDRL